MSDVRFNPAGPVFPRTRMRRNRRRTWSRRLVREARPGPDDLIWPLFIQEGEDQAVAIPGMPGVWRYSIDRAVTAVGEATGLGIPAVAVFPAIDPALKTPGNEEAWNPDNLVCRAVRAIKRAHPDVGVIADAALDPFNPDGHDGLLRDGEVLNDETVAILCRQAQAQAQAGCDAIAPSDMMDGRIGAIRDALDHAGHTDVLVIAYAAKYASCLYDPFRAGVASAAALGGRSKASYQLDPANGAEALREVALDVAEGADMVIVKPGLHYLDMVRRVRDRFDLPVLAYHVSGEYAMLKYAAAAGALDEAAATRETLLAFKRAGADAILTYCALDAARLWG